MGGPLTLIFFLWPTLEVSCERARDIEPAFVLNLILDSNYIYILNSMNIYEMSPVRQTLFDVGESDFNESWIFTFEEFTTIDRADRRARCHAAE